MQVEFKTSRGKKVSFKARPASKRSGPRKIGKFAKFVKSFSRSHKSLKGPKLFKAASREYKKK